MKIREYILISLFVLSSFSMISQERGMKPVQVNIEGTSTTLYHQSHALLIGVSAYSAGLPPLPGVVEDINLVKSAMENSGFNVVTVMNPDNAGLQKAFTSFISKYGQGANNRLFIYFAGHGYTEKMPYGDDIGYICPVDVPDPNKNPAGFQEKAMPMRQIETYAYQIKSKHALFMFDACFSGSIFSTSRAIPEVISYKTKEPVRQFITSGGANETVPDKSIFRGQFLRALQGEADGNQDGFLTGTELGEFLQSTVVNYSSGAQHPQYGKIRNPNLDKGDFVFVLNAGQQSAVGGQQPGQVITVEETSLVRYGQLELTTEIGGELYIDDAFIKNVNANTLVTLNNLTEGRHNLVIKGAETYEQWIDIPANETEKLTVEKKLTDTAGIPEMVFIQGGTFQMGGNDGGDDEKPVHSVTINNFYMGKYEVTQKQWQEIMGNNPSYFKNCDNCPVESVSWNDVQDFIRKLNEKTGKNYRLPTEAEWEYAARGGNKSRGFTYSGSNKVGEVGWYDGNSGSKTHPVGQKQANEIGLYDMTGNVWEWCSDWYRSDYYKSSSSSNPKGPTDSSFRVLRGGSWYSKPARQRVSYRYHDVGYPSNRSDVDGFRIARTE